MNSTTATVVLTTPCARVYDFNAAAMAAYKKRLESGELEFLAAGSPLMEYARAQGEPIIDITWMVQQAGRLRDDVIDAIGDIAHETCKRMPGGGTDVEYIMALHGFLREAERLNLLEGWQTPNTDAR